MCFIKRTQINGKGSTRRDTHPREKERRERERDDSDELTTVCKQEHSQVSYVATLEPVNKFTLF